jgi:antitoxin (DNA-binding transcriptional repressor) of toxin-antitoxin stability system
MTIRSAQWNLEQGDSVAIVITIVTNTGVLAMTVVSKAVLKARMLEYFRRVEESGEPLIVTSHRKPVLRVEPIRERGSLVDAFADLRGKARAKRSVVLAPETAEWGDV